MVEYNKSIKDFFMKKLLLSIVLIIAVAGGYYYYQNMAPDIIYEKVISYRLKDALGFDTVVGEVIVYDESDVMDIENIQFLHPMTGQPFLIIESLKGIFDRQALIEKRILYFRELDMSGIILPGIEKKIEIDPKKQDVNFREIFSEWDHKENIQKATESILGFYEKSHETQLKKATEVFETIQSVESFVKQSTKENFQQLEKKLKELEMGVLNYQDLQSRPSAEKIESFIQSKNELVKKNGFFEKDFFEFLFDDQLKKDGKKVAIALRALYKAQFYSVKAREDFPHLIIDKIKIFEKFRPDDKNVLVGFINNLSSRHDGNRKKMKILLQGDFSKYDIKGLDIRVGIFKDDNKIITYTGRVEEFPMKKRVLYEDDKRVVFSLPSIGRFAFKGTVHKSEVRADLSYETLNLKFYHSPVHDKVITQLLTKYESNEKNRINIIIDDKPEENKGYIAIEYGDKYLDPVPSKELFDAYVEDVLDNYFRNMEVQSEEVKAQVKSLEDKAKAAKELVNKIKEKLNK